MSSAELHRRALGPSLGLVAAQLRSWVGDAGTKGSAQRAAGAAYAIRVASAAAVYLTQVVLARWMGTSEFGIYVYVWTLVSLAGDVIHLGLPLAAQRFIPEYTAAQSYDRLRGFILGARRTAFGFALALSAIAALIVKAFEPAIGMDMAVPLYFACVTLPFFTLSVVLDGIARSYNWIDLALAPHFLFRPLLTLALMAVAHWYGFPVNATMAMGAVALATSSMAIVQLVLIDRRLGEKIPRGARTYELKTWLATSLPIVMVWGFYTLLTYTDVIVLQQFGTPDDVALYYAVARTLLLVTFVYFSVSAAVAHRFSAAHVARDRAALAALVARATRWTFWPSLAATLVILALGWPLLWLFGPQFTAGYPLMFILAIGPLARASVGPAERLLNMLGQQNICAIVYALAFAINLGGCFALAPRYGATGVAVAMSAAIVFESAALYVIVKRRLGLHVFIWGLVNGTR